MVMCKLHFTMSFLGIGLEFSMLCREVEKTIDMREAVAQKQQQESKATNDDEPGKSL